MGPLSSLNGYNGIMTEGERARRSAGRDRWHMEQPTPSNVMFEVFKELGGLSYKDLASLVLTDRPVWEGRSPRSRVDDKTWVSRYLVHAPASAVPDRMFDDFEASARRVVARLKRADGPALSNGAIVACFAGAAAQRMKAALDAAGRDGALYLNVLRRIGNVQDVPESDRADLLVLHFLVTGCTNDPRRSADRTLGYAQRALGLSFKTTLPSVVEIDDESDAEPLYLCLLRVENGRIKGAPYYLNPGSEGTEIGSLSTAQYSITDVEDTVSARHVRIWRAENGRWYVEGLDSKNGTVLVSGADRREAVVEPPRKDRTGFVSRPMEILPSDELVLARDTVFMVMEGVAS